jgi:hypothetical protein
VLANAGDDVLTLDPANSNKRYGPFPNASDFHLRVVHGNNTVFVPNGDGQASGTPFASFQAFQAAGYESPDFAPSTVSGFMPSADQIIAWAKQVLSPPAALELRT